MSIEKIVGNAALKQALAAALASDKLCHCVLLCGGKGMGAGFAALCLAADYMYPDGNGANVVFSGNCTELIVLQGEGVAKEIKIDAVRQMRKDIFSTALFGTRRCVIIKNAENFNSSSANAVLKLLEEPPENVLFILTAPSVSAVLATIRSRACAYTLSDVSDLECTSYLEENFQDLDLQKAKYLSEVFAGRIGLCVKAIQSADCAGALDTAQNIYLAIKNRDEYSILSVLSKYEKDKPAVNEIIENLRYLLCNSLKDTHEISAHVASKAILPLYQAQRLLKSNVNSKLVYTCLAADLAAANNL